MFNPWTRKFESIAQKPEYYKCVKEYRGFTVGKVYKTNEYGDLPSDPENPFVIWIENPCFKEYFRPATEEEIPHEDYHWNGEIRVREVTGVLKKMIDNIDEESLAKTREEMLKESSDGELTEFENCMMEYYVTGTVPIEGDGGEELSKLTKEYSSKLLSIARKQLQPEIDAEIDKAYKNQDKVQYRNGYNKCVEDARNAFCKTCKIGKCNSSECVYLNDFKKALIGE